MDILKGKLGKVMLVKRERTPSSVSALPLATAVFACALCLEGVSGAPSADGGFGRCAYTSGFAYDLKYGSYIELPNSIFVNHDAVTFSLWIKLYSLSPRNGGLIGSIFDSTLSANEGLLLRGHNNEIVFLAGSSFAYDSLCRTATIPIMEWHHIAATFFWNSTVNGNARLYVDGQPVCNIPNQGRSRASIYMPFVVGKFEDTRASFQADEISLWGRALADTEVARVYNAKLSGKEKDLLLYWVADGDNATHAIDHSGNGRHGSLIPGSLKNVEGFRFAPNCRGCFNSSYPRCGPWDSSDDICGDGVATGAEQCDGRPNAKCSNVTCRCINGTVPHEQGCIDPGTFTCQYFSFLPCSSTCDSCTCARVDGMECMSALNCDVVDVVTPMLKSLPACLSACTPLGQSKSALAFTKEECERQSFKWCSGQCVASALSCLEMCGNGVLDPFEACDDGNVIDGDGCSANCSAVVPGWKCTEGSCHVVCGDGIFLRAHETCDDGNNVSGDGCSGNCSLLEEGFICDTTVQPTRCVMKKGLSVGGIVGIAVAGAVAVAACISLAFVVVVLKSNSRAKALAIANPGVRMSLTSLMKTPPALGGFDPTESMFMPNSFPIEFSPSVLRFGIDDGARAPLDEPLTDTLTLSTTSGKWHFRIHNDPNVKYDLVISPNSGTAKKGAPVTVSLQLMLLCTTNLKLKLPLVISETSFDDENCTKKHTFVDIHVESKLTTRLDPDELELTEPPIGDGSYGRVYRGNYRSQDVAVKVLKFQDTALARADFEREVRIMDSLRSQFIIGFVGAVMFPGRLCLVTEFIPLGSLGSVLYKRNLTYGLKLRILYDCARGMAYLHGSKIMHCDLKLDNLLMASLDEEALVVCKLTDFGTTREASDVMSANYTIGVGTPIYMAPELLSTDKKEYSMAADIYSFGVMMHEIYTEVQPYSNDPQFAQPWHIGNFVSSGKRLPIPADCPENYSRLLSRCWTQDSTERPSFEQITAELKGIIEELHSGKGQ